MTFAHAADMNLNTALTMPTCVMHLSILIDFLCPTPICATIKTCKIPFVPLRCISKASWVFVQMTYLDQTVLLVVIKRLENNPNTIKSKLIYQNSDEVMKRTILPSNQTIQVASWKCINVHGVAPHSITVSSPFDSVDDENICGFTCTYDVEPMRW